MHQSLISNAQSKYLIKFKEGLPENGEFAENYQFIIENKVQGFHRNSSQFTLHSVVIYFKSYWTLFSQPVYYSSDDLVHDVDMVYELIKNTFKFLKTFLPFNI